MREGVKYTMPKQRVKEVAEERGWSSAMDIVRNAKIGTTTAYSIWNDPEYVPSVQVLARIAQALGVSLKDLLLDDPTTANDK